MVTKELVSIFMDGLEELDSDLQAIEFLNVTIEHAIKRGALAKGEVLSLLAEIESYIPEKCLEAKPAERKLYWLKVSAVLDFTARVTRFIADDLASKFK